MSVPKITDLSGNQIMFTGKENWFMQWEQITATVVLHSRRWLFRCPTAETNYGIGKEGSHDKKGHRHLINDSGANISIATVQLAKEAIRRGFQAYPHEGDVKIKTAGEGANLQLQGGFGSRDT